VDIVVDASSAEKFEQDYGYIMSLDEFIGHCEHGMFIDYDGFAGEILLNGNIICKQFIYPSKALRNKAELLQKQVELGKLDVVWYNK
jgi:hypothetical protein